MPASPFAVTEKARQPVHLPGFAMAARQPEREVQHFLRMQDDARGRQRGDTRESRGRHGVVMLHLSRVDGIYYMLQSLLRDCFPAGLM